MFYRKLAPLCASRHGDLGLRRDLNFGFARSATLVPLLASEFAAAAVWYPIVFSLEDPAVPLAVLGVRAKENLFVEPDLSWRSGAYVPAYLRRYPFHLAESADELILCVDEHEEILVPDGRALFNGDEPSPLVRRALEFCRAMQREEQLTGELCEALGAAGLLSPRTASFGDEASSPGLPPFRMVEETLFRELQDATFLTWRRRGWLGAVYAHLGSTLNWQKLADGAARGRASAIQTPQEELA